METPSTGLDFDEITTRQRRMWRTGDFNRIGIRLVLVSERLAMALDIRPGERVLDVAAGAGNTALAAARRDAHVAASDYVPELLEQAAQRASMEGLPLETRVADAQALPFDDASFDVVTSTFGVMFAPDQVRAAAELMRVLRPGGRLGLANWTPGSVIGQQFLVTARYASLPPGLVSPTRWGTEDGLRELLGAGTREIRIERQTVDFTAHSYDELFDRYRIWFGPVATVYARLDPATAREYAEAWKQVWHPFNRADDGTVVATAEYLEAIVVK